MLLRTDDLTHTTAKIERFLDITKDVPVICATQPKDILDNLDDFDSVIPLVKKYKNATIVQHGYDHINRAKDDEKKCEFPSSRNPDDFISDIIKGKKILEDNFKKQFYPVFVPPWNRFGHNYQILSEVGFVGYEDDEGFLDMQPKKGWIDSDYFWRKIQTDDTIHGLMFHHEWMTDEQFKFLEQLIESGVISWKSIRESS
tara:strand:+ start:1097 stop:1696 length:600 start_codon:yes stop_codon:yes gene_type:complete